MFDIDSIKSLEDTQRSNFYRAKVISLNDPLNLNRVQILIYGLTDDIPNENQPFTELQFTAGIVTYPIVNDVIWLFFEGGDIFRPIYLGTVYAGTDVDTETGYNNYSANLNAVSIVATSNQMNAGFEFSAITDVETYRSSLRIANNIEKDQHLVLKDTVSHFDVLSAESTWWKKFSGLDEIDVSTAAAGTFQWLAGVDPDYGPCPFPKGEKMYPWYELREHTGDTSNPEYWKSIYGGWRFLTSAELAKGLIYFPDNVRRTYLKRYKSWASWTVWNSLAKTIWIPESNVYQNAVPKSWNFIPSSPSVYIDPEMYSVAFSRDAVTVDNPDPDVHSESMQGYARLKPFPFGKMKIKNRQHYKQSMWLSYDGKSAIEMDDNENYERLALNFNYGESGLEFARQGWHGIEMWSEGSLKMKFFGRQGSGRGPYGQFVRSSIEAIGHDLYIQSDKALGMGGDSSVSMTALGPAGVRSKMDVTSITGGGGVTIQTEAGLSTREGVSDANRGIWMGSPVILGPAGEKAPTGGMNGWMAVLPDVAQEAAEKYYNSLNAILVLIKKLVSWVDAKPAVIDQYTAVPVAQALYTWAKGAKTLVKDIDVGTLQGVSVMGASEKINVEGGAKTA